MPKTGPKWKYKWTNKNYNSHSYYYKHTTQLITFINLYQLWHVSAKSAPYKTIPDIT